MKMARINRACLLLFASIFLARNVHATIRYSVSLAQPEKHLFHVTMIIPNVGQDIDVAMPAWNATYDIRDFAFRVTDVRASALEPNSAGAPLNVINLDKQTWKISIPAADMRGKSDTVEVQYDDYWDEPGPFSSQLNTHHAFLNLAEVLFYVPARRSEPTEVQYTDIPQNWRVAEELPSGALPTSFDAANYDALVDAPAEIGTFKEFEFDVKQVPIRVVVDGKDWDEGALRDVLRKIVDYETGMMRDVPFREYTFFLRFGSYAEVGGGGMEHANCNAISTASADTVANVAAHEFFHLWNVKRIRPQTLEPVDYTKEMWTRALWFAEGVTSTYAAYTMVRTGLWSHDQFYTDLARQISTLESRPAHLTQSAEESSLDTWLDKYDYYNRPDVSISYYNKGQILGVMLDLAIRNATMNHKSLDDVMRAMDEDYAQRGRFYDDSAGIEQEAEKVAGRSFKDFFTRYVAGTDEIPYEDYLRTAGLQLKTETAEMADLGFDVSRGPGGAIQIADVATGSSAESAGLQSGDVLLQLDGEPFPRFAMRWLMQHSPGDKVKLRIQRNGEEREVSFALGGRNFMNCSIGEISDATKLQKSIREGILKGTTDSGSVESSGQRAVANPQPVR
jgi:predicted metalloprotease with PDZ domain